MENFKSLTNMEDNLLSRLKPEYMQAMVYYVKESRSPEEAEINAGAVATLVDVLRRTKFWLDLSFNTLETLSRVLKLHQSHGKQVTIVHPTELFYAAHEIALINMVSSATLDAGAEHFGYVNKDAK